MDIVCVQILRGISFFFQEKACWSTFEIFGYFLRFWREFFQKDASRIYEAIFTIISLGNFEVFQLNFFPGAHSEILSRVYLDFISGRSFEIWEFPKCFSLSFCGSFFFNLWLNFLLKLVRSSFNSSFGNSTDSRITSSWICPIALPGVSPRIEFSHRIFYELFWEFL